MKIRTFVALMVLSLSIVSIGKPWPAKAESSYLELSTIAQANNDMTSPQFEKFVGKNSGKGIVAEGTVFKADDSGGNYCIFMQSDDGTIFETCTDEETMLSVRKGSVYRVTGKFGTALDVDPERHPVLHEFSRHLLTDGRRTNLLVSIKSADLTYLRKGKISWKRQAKQTFRKGVQAISGWFR